MASPVTDSDEPLTPAGRLFLQPEMDQIIHCVIGFKNPLDTESIKAGLRNSILLKHPRFSSLMVRDRHGVEYWRKTSIDFDRHIITIESPITTASVDDETAVNEYLADLSTGPGLSTDKPLWEIQLLKAHKCVVLRIHHCLGDGISLMSMLLACCRKVDDDNALPTIGSASNRTKSKEGKLERRCLGRFWGFLKMVWFSFVYVVEFILRCLCVCDRQTAISGGAGVELWPRKLVTARFWLRDMKVVKKAIPNATINDVLFGVISSGLSRYLDHQATNVLQEGLQITGVAMVNLREQPGVQELSNLMMRSNIGSRWGNKFGIVLLPIQYQKSGTDPLQYLKRAKVMIDRKKQSAEAHFSYRIGYFVMTRLGAKLASLLNYRIVCNTSFTISNIVGPQEEIAFRGNPISYLRATSSGLPHALTMHMVSYAGRADMQILVAKDIIPDPEFLAKCFEEALLQMKEAAEAVVKA
uniref:O-acyltransferase WSD1-like isoform X2 n=1 Tax=Ziziphus jujuba TaxID=326968 RepID=A0A6P4ACR1_ZIZJJ